MAEKLCSRQGREHRELQELGLQEMELRSSLRGERGVREEQGDQTRLRVPESLREQSWCLIVGH